MTRLASVRRPRLWHCSIECEGATVHPAHNLPHVTSPFIGRIRQIGRLSAWLAEPGCQLVTITGLSGSGKTRLALQVARGFATPDNAPSEQPFPDGIFLVDGSDGVRAVQRVAADLSDRAMLLVLDDFDQPGESVGFCRSCSRGRRS